MKPGLFLVLSGSTHLCVSEHGWQVVGFGAEVKMVENVLLHGVQVRVFHILLLSVGKQQLHQLQNHNINHTLVLKRW